MGLSLLRWMEPSQKVWRECGVRFAWLQPHLLHSGALCSRRLLHSILWLQCSLPTASIQSNLSPPPPPPPSTNKPRQCPREKASEKRLKPYQRRPRSGGGRVTEETEGENRGGTSDDASVCCSASSSSSSSLVTECVPAHLMPAALLNVLHFNSIPSGCDHSTAEPARV